MGVWHCWRAAWVAGKEANKLRIEFSPKPGGARSRLYRRRFHQVNIRWKALAEIYTMHFFASFSNLNLFFIADILLIFTIVCKFWLVSPFGNRIFRHALGPGNSGASFLWADPG